MFSLVDAPITKRIRTKPKRKQGRPRKTDRITKSQRHTWNVGEALQLRIEKGLTYRDIAYRYQINPATVHQAFKPFRNLLESMGDKQAIKAFTENRPKLLSVAEMALLDDLTKQDKREKASLNNTAYALRQVHDMRRLEEGKSIGGNASISFKFNFGGDVQVDLASEAEVVPEAGGNRLITHETEVD